MDIAASLMTRLLIFAVSSYRRFRLTCIALGALLVALFIGRPVNFYYGTQEGDNRRVTNQTYDRSVHLIPLFGTGRVFYSGGDPANGRTSTSAYCQLRHFATAVQASAFDSEPFQTLASPPCSGGTCSTAALKASNGTTYVASCDLSSPLEPLHESPMATASGPDTDRWTPTVINELKLNYYSLLHVLWEFIDSLGRSAAIGAHMGLAFGVLLITTCILVEITSVVRRFR